MMVKLIIGWSGQWRKGKVYKMIFPLWCFNFLIWFNQLLHNVLFSSIFNFYFLLLFFGWITSWCVIHPYQVNNFMVCDSSIYNVIDYVLYSLTKYLLFHSSIPQRNNIWTCNGKHRHPFVDFQSVKHLSKWMIK